LNVSVFADIMVMPMANIDNMQGNLTLGENLADSGVIQAYRAWKSASDAQSDFALPGLNYTQCVQKLLLVCDAFR
jgi:predicted metalloendopeptidase